MHRGGGDWIIFTRYFFMEDKIHHHIVEEVEGI